MSEAVTFATHARQSQSRAFASNCLLVLLVVGCVSRTRHEPEATGEAASAASLGAAPAKPASARSDPSLYPKSERLMLLKLARESLTVAVKQRELMPTPNGLPAALTENKGAFVTLTIHGQLRGCIGNIFPDKPLAQAVIHNANAAALNDSRFSPVAVDELAVVEVEVSVLSIPTPLGFSSPHDLIHLLRPHRDGVVLSIGQRRATFLPQVWEQLPDAAEFLDHLSAKAGLQRGAWRDPTTQIQIYQVQAFKETDPDLK